MLVHRVLAAVALAGLALSACQPGQGPGLAPLTEADRKAITDGIARFDQAMQAGDWPTAVSLYSEDVVLLPPNSPVVQGRAGAQKLFEGFPKITEFTESVVEIDGQGDLAYARGTYEVTMMPAGAKAPLKDRGKVLAVWRKQPDGAWLASRVSWNSDLAPTR